MSRIDVCANANIIFLLSDAQRTLKGKDLQGKGVKKCCLVFWVHTEEPIKFIQLTCCNWCL